MTTDLFKQYVEDIGRHWRNGLHTVDTTRDRLDRAERRVLEEIEYYTQMLHTLRRTRWELDHAPIPQQKTDSTERLR